MEINADMKSYEVMLSICFALRGQAQKTNKVVMVNA